MSVSCKCCVRFQVYISATGRPLVQRSPIGFGVSGCYLQTPSHKKKKLCIHTSDLFIGLQIFMVTKIYFVVLWDMD
jgi:hypothetical protein